LNKLRILINKNFSVTKNLAVEESILKLLDENKTVNTLRLWINPKSAIAGISNEIYETINVQYCLKNGIEINRRITGGGAIYNDEGNLNWSFFFKKDNLKFNSLIQYYKYFSNYIIKSLESLSIKVNFYEPNWLGINNFKISGMAGYIKRNCILIHGTLLIDSNLINLENVCKLHYKYPKVMNISEIKNVKVNDVILSIIDFLRKNFDVSINYELNNEEETLSNTLENIKYKTISWIFKSNESSGSLWY